MLHYECLKLIQILMKQILLSLILLNSVILKAQDPCDGPAGCPIYEHIKDEGEHMLEQFMGAAVVVLVVMGVGGAAASAGGEPSEFSLDKNIIQPGIQIMPLDSRFEVNTLTLEKLDFHNEFDFNKTSINLLELKYKLN